ncbi:unnamed protein product [Rotaria sp. Silwood1]|nr:unnamed protein product [Rotaria sp. Silwood1]
MYLICVNLKMTSGFITEKEEQPDQMSQQGLSAGDSWSSATSLDRFIPPTITQPLLSTYRYRSGERVQLQVEYFSPSVQCHCTWQVQHSNDTVPQPIQDGLIVNTNYSSTLTIDSITSELQGIYIFHVENVYGHASTQTHIIVDKEDIDDEQQEYQEALEEPPMKKKFLEDDSHLHLMSPHHKRISMMHHMPLEESVKHEDLKVHLPGGSTEEIIIHTEFIPPTPRLSLIEEQSTSVWVEQDLSKEQIQTGDTYKIESVDTKITMDTQQLQLERESVDRIQFGLQYPSSFSDIASKLIHEDIPQTTVLTVQQQQVTRPTGDILTVIEESQVITSTPISFDEALSNVKQWSDLIPDQETLALPSIRRASRISNLLTSANEYEDEQHIAHPVHQRLAIGSIITSGKADIVKQPEVGPHVPLLDESSIALSQFRQSEIPQSYEYKAPIDVKEEPTAVLRTSALAMSGDDMETYGTPINVSHLRRQESGGTKQAAVAVSQPSVTIDYPILDESAIHLGQLQRPELPQSVEYKLPVDSQLSTGSFPTTASALSEEEPAQETSFQITQFIQPSAKDLPISDTIKQQASTIIQPSLITDLPVLHDAVVRLDQVHRPDAPQSVQYKAPADIQPSVGTILTTASGLISEEPAHETPVNISQLRQPIAKDIAAPSITEQQASSVMHLSATADLPILDDTSINLDQVHRPNAPQSVHYKAPTDIQPSVGTILTTASGLISEEPAYETPVNISQLRQPIAKDIAAPSITEQQASSVMHLSATADLPILDETSINLGQIHRPDAPQVVQYKAPTDIEPSTSSIRTNKSVLGVEEPAQEVSINVNQVHQAAAQEILEEKKQRRLDISQLTQDADLPLLDKTTINVDQVYQAEEPQSIESTLPANIKQVSATLRSSPSVLASETEHDETISTSVEGYQQQQGHKTYRPVIVSDLSYAPAEDEFAELPYEIRCQQQRLLKMPPKSHEQPKLIQSRTSIVENDDETHSTIIGQRRQMVPSVKEPEGKKDEEEEEKSISPESSMNVDEVIETIHLEDELLEPKKPFLSDIPAPTDEDMPFLVPTDVEVLPSIEEVPQTTDKEISMLLNQLETVSSDKSVTEELQPSSDIQSQSSLDKLDHVSLTQPTSLHLHTTEEVLSSATIEKAPETLLPQEIEVPFEIVSKKIVDYIEIPHLTTDSDEQKPEAIIITDEIIPTESISSVEGETSDIASSESLRTADLRTETIHHIKGDVTYEHISHSALIDKSEKSLEESVESLPVPVQSNLLPLATMPDGTINGDKRRVPEKIVQHVLAVALEPTRVGHVEDTSQTTQTPSVTQLQTTAAFQTEPFEQDAYKDTVKVKSARTASPVPVSMDQDQFFDAESETMSEMVKTEIKRIVSSHEQPVTLALAEKLQHDVSVEQKMEEFHEPEVTLTSTEASSTNELQPFQVSLEKTTSDTQEISSKTLVQEEIKPAEGIPLLQQETVFEKQVIESSLPSQQQPTGTEITELTQEISLLKDNEQLKIPPHEPQPMVYDTSHTLTSTGTESLTQGLITLEQYDTTQDVTEISMKQAAKFDETITQKAASDLQTLSSVEEYNAAEQVPISILETDHLKQSLLSEKSFEQSTVTDVSKALETEGGVQKTTIEQVTTATTSIPIDQIDKQALSETQRVVLEPKPTPTEEYITVEQKATAESASLQKTTAVEQPQLELIEEQKLEKIEQRALQPPTQQQPKSLEETQITQSEQQKEKPAYEEKLQALQKPELQAVQEQEVAQLAQLPMKVYDEQKQTMVEQPKPKLADEQKVPQREEPQPQPTPAPKSQPVEQTQMPLGAKSKPLEEVRAEPIQQLQQQPTPLPQAVEVQKVESVEQLQQQSTPTPQPAEVQKIQLVEQLQQQPTPQPLEVSEAEPLEKPHQQPTPVPQPVEVQKVEPVEQTQQQLTTTAHPIEVHKAEPVEQLPQQPTPASQSIEEKQHRRVPDFKSMELEKVPSVQQEKLQQAQESMPVAKEKTEPVQQLKPESTAELKPICEDRAEAIEQSQSKLVPEPKPVKDQKVEPATQIEEKTAIELELEALQEQQTEQPKQPEPKKTPGIIPKPVEEQKAKQLEEPPVKQAPETQLESIEEKKAKTTEEQQPKQVSEEKPKSVEEKQEKKVEQVQPKTVPGPTKPVEEEKVKQPEQPLAKPAPEEKPKPIEEQKVKKPEEPQPKQHPEEKPKQVEEKKGKKVEQPQPITVTEQAKLVEEEKVKQPEEKPKPVEEQKVKKTEELQPKTVEEKKGKKVEQPQPKTVPEQPKPVEEEKVKQPEQPAAKSVPEQKPKPVEEQKAKKPEEPQPKTVEEKKDKKTEQTQPKQVLEEKPKPVEEQKAKKPAEPQSKQTPEEKPKPVEEQKGMKLEQPQAKAVVEEPKFVEEQKEKKPKQPEPKPTPEETPKAPEEQKGKKAEQAQPKPSSEEKPKSVEEQKGKKSEQPLAKPAPEDKSKVVEEPKGKKAEQSQPKPTPEEKPKPVEEQKGKKPEQPQTKQVPDEKPTPVEQQKGKKAEQPQPKPTTEEKPKQVEEEKGKKLEQAQTKPTSEEKAKLAEEQKGKKAEESLAKAAPEEKPKPVEEQKGKKVEQPQPKPTLEEKLQPIEEQKGKKTEPTQSKQGPEDKTKLFEEQKGKKVEQLQAKPTPDEKSKPVEEKLKTVEQQKAKPSEEKKTVTPEIPVEKKQEGKVAQKSALTEEQKGKADEKEKKTQPTVIKPGLTVEAIVPVSDTEKKEKVETAPSQVTSAEQQKMKSIEEKKSDVQKAVAEKKEGLATVQKVAVGETQKQTEDTEKKTSVETTTAESPTITAEHDYLRPNFTLRLKPTIAVTEGDKLKLEVRFIAQPEPTVTWYFKTGVLKPSPNIHIDQLRDVHMFCSILTIDKVNNDFDGKFKVVLKNELGEVMSATQVNVKRSTVAAQLHAPPRKTSASEAAPLSPNEVSLTTASSSEGEAMLSEPTSTTEERRASTLVVPEGKPAFTQPLESELLVNEDEQLTLECTITGNPLPQLNWLFNDRKVIIGNDYQTKSETLSPHTVRHQLIISPKHKKIGTYKAQAQNKYGHTISSCSVKKSSHILDRQKKAAFQEAELQVPAPTIQRRRSSVTAPANIEQTQQPIIVQGLSILQIDLGSPCALTCKSQYDTEHQWFKDGQPILSTKSSDENIFRKTDRSNDGNLHVLNIKKFQQENIGNYELVLKNNLGEKNSQGRLEMKGIPPTFVLEPKTIAVVKGKIAEFNCRVAGSPKPEVQWFLNEKSLHSGGKISIVEERGLSILRINNITDTDTGTIKCLVKNALAEIQREVQLQITGEQRAPKIIEKSQSKEVNADESVEFFVKVSGAPTPTVTWTRKGMTISSNEFYQLRTDNDTYYLLIKKAIADVAGTYVITAVNTAGKVSADIDLTVTGLSTLFVRPLRDISVTQGRPLTLDCEVNVQKGVPTIVWMKDNTPIVKSDRIIPSLKGNKVHVLTIKQALASDTGYYSIKATLGNETSTSDAQVLVQVPPTIVKIPDTITVVDGQDCEINIEVAGLPSPILKWSHLAEDLTTNSKYKITSDGNNHQLRIQHASVQDAGDYQVLCTNSVGRATGKITVRISSPPIIIEPLKDLFVPIKRTARLETRIDAFPEAKATWSKNAIPIDFSLYAGRMVAEEKRGIYSLVIKNIQLDDGGFYVCTAQNSLGQVKTSATLTIEMAPLFLNKLEKLEGVENCDIDIRVQVAGYPKPNLEFAFNQNPIDLKGRYSLKELKDGWYVFTIANTKRTDAGTYSCTATNSLGQVSCVGKLTLFQLSEPNFTKNLTDALFPVGGIIKLDIKVSGLPLPRLTWLKDGQIFDENDRISIVFDPRTAKLTLTINDCQESDTGIYECRAKNPGGEKITKCKITVSGEAPTFIDSPEKVSCLEGQTAVFGCRVSGDPYPMVVWSRGKTKTFTENTPKYALYYDDELDAHFFEINQCSNADTGIYTVTIQNIHATITKPVSCFTVTKPEEVIDYKSVLRKMEALQREGAGGPDWGKLKKGKAKAKGPSDPGWQYKLKHFELTGATEVTQYEQPQDVDLVGLSPSELAARRSRGGADGGEGLESDDGRGLNASTSTAAKGRKVSRLGLVTFTKPLANVTVFEGKLATFECNISEAEASVTWLINDQPVSNQRGQILAIGKTRRLNLKDCLLNENNSTITCVLDEATKTTAQLFVKEEPFDFVDKLKNLKIKHGDKCELQCTVNKPNIALQWFKDGNLITDIKEEVDGLIHKLIIPNIEDKGKGAYVAKYQDVQTEGHVEVLDEQEEKITF